MRFVYNQKVLYLRSKMYADIAVGSVPMHYNKKI